MTTIYLIRHGEIAQTRPRRFVGQQDLPLTDTGRRQMAHLAAQLAGRGIDRIFCSPLRRAVESARILALHLGLETVGEIADLREIGLGAWEGLTVEEVRNRFPGEYEARGEDIVGFTPAGGESFATLLERAWPAWLAITEGKEGRLAVVAHAGINRVLLCRMLGMPLDRLLSVDQPYACLSVVHRERSGFRVEGLDCR